MGYPRPVHGLLRPAFVFFVFFQQVFGEAEVDNAGGVCSEDGAAPHPTKCDYFYDCWKGTANVGRCPMSMLFNDDKLYCDYPQNVNCGIRTIASSVDEVKGCPYNWGLAPNVEDCSSYYHCSRGRKVNMARCHDGLLFDPERLTCNWAEKVNCHGAKKPPPMFSCPENDGYFPNPKDCHKLFLCQKGEPRMLGCPTGQTYDNNLKRCVPNPLPCITSNRNRFPQLIKRSGEAKPDERQRPEERRPEVSQNAPNRNIGHFRENLKRIRVHKSEKL